MPGLLTHTPADILRWCLIDLGYGTDPDDDDSWPIFVGVEPPEPDNCITIGNYLGIDGGREMIGRERAEYDGIQVRVRSSTLNVGWAKCHAIGIALDQSIYDNTVTIGASSYVIHSVRRTTNVLSLGKEPPTSKRDLFTINALLCVRTAS